MNRRDFVRVSSTLLLLEVANACTKNVTSPSSVPSPTPPIGASAHPVNPVLAGVHVRTVISKVTGNLQDALYTEGLNPASSLVTFRNSNGTTGRDYLIHTLNGDRPANGFDFMINNGHYFAAAYNFPVRAGERIDIYKPPMWNGVSD